MALVQQSAPVMDLPPIDSSEFIEDGSIVTSFEQETASSGQTLFELDYDLEPDLPEVERSDSWVHNVEAELDMSEDGSSQAQAGLSNHSLEAEPVYTHSPQAGEGDVLQSPEQAVTFREPVLEGLLDHHTDPPQPTEEAAVTDPAVTDPWQDPLPSWDYSQNEWPVLIGPPKPKQSAVLRTSLVALVLLAAGGFYYFILQPTLREQRPSAPVDTKGAERAAVAVQADVPEAKPAEPSPSPVASSPSSETPASAPATIESTPIQLPEDGNTHGKFALQAAAFPNQAGADEFAEKLKKAGVPSYIVSADLGRRGRWFRVRVGRFNSADDAQKFAAEAQLRAKAAGMSLQLIGCQYDQP